MGYKMGHSSLEILLPYQPYRTHCGRRAMHITASRALVKTGETTMGERWDYMLVYNYSCSKGEYMLLPD